ncbi:hypothetical protein SPRG_15467 [Saprolegnia parasitica CBS 223.65]|uniref:Uncharacterized protein n=1 Tax=Saprolegnia parasitica (strain CBS 223.65) TaxID=695850 RepID=A0A067BXS7_SAPPC|nr:hypothetical protein SPRG_15467 [Saprolegnia parasitica CBS 223.65]KDO19377.1 hypothetical protein SPRG_15467 [Saprolegnia parasitica CBS 223.65]|eukprot:XP_012209922.1 hypothetical protein SPRG_15467 [Saprolegnia parasitica CBS 223.65]
MSAIVKGKKEYLADQKAFMAHFQARPLALQLVKSTLLQGLFIVNGYVESLDLENDDESDDDEPKADKPAFVAPSPREFVIRCQLHCVKTLSNTTVLRSLEFISIRILDVRVAGKLVKDVTKSALRKYARHQSATTAAFQIVKTGVRASVLGSVAIFLVEEIIAICHAIQCKLQATAIETERQLLQVTLLGLRRCGLAIVGSAAGGAIGTLVSPGKGTLVGALVGETLAYSF